MRARQLRVRLSHGRLPSTTIFLVVDAFLEHAERRCLGWIVGLFRRIERRRRFLRRFIQQHAQWRIERWLEELGWLSFIVLRWRERRWLVRRRLFFFIQLFSRRQSGRVLGGAVRRRLVGWQFGRIAGRWQ
jgi:hypothetical protein